MATQHVNLSYDAATNITDGLTLTDGMSYTAQAQGGAVRFMEQADATDPDFTDDTERATAESNSFIIHANGDATLRAASGNEIFAWAATRAGARLVVSTGYS